MCLDGKTTLRSAVRVTHKEHNSMAHKPEFILVGALRWNDVEIVAVTVAPTASSWFPVIR